MQVFKVTPQIKSVKSSKIDESGKRFQRYVWKCSLPFGNVFCYSKNKKHIPDNVKNAISKSKEYQLSFDDQFALIDFNVLYPEPIKLEIESISISSITTPEVIDIVDDSSVLFEPVTNEFEDLESISRSIQSRFEEPKQNSVSDPPDEDEEEVIPLSKEEIKANASKLISALAKNNTDYFSSLYNGSGFEINATNAGGITAEFDIKPDSLFHSKVMFALKKRRKAIFKVDSIDGELAFCEFINVLLSKIGFKSRVKLDNEYYEDMGDSGDIRIASKRIDVKTRQALGRKCNLLINEETLSKDLNYFVYIVREGDSNREGSRRRLNIKGYITQEKAKQGKQIEITKTGSKKPALKREFESHEILPLNGLICDIVLSLLKKEIV